MPRRSYWHLLVPLRNVDPHETVVAVEQGQQCVAVMLMSSRGVYESDVHVASVSQSFCPVKKHGTGHANATLCDPPPMQRTVLLETLAADMGYGTQSEPWSKADSTQRTLGTDRCVRGPAAFRRVSAWRTVSSGVDGRPSWPNRVDTRRRGAERGSS